MLTAQIPASEELNKINIFLRRASTTGLYAPFETYLNKLLFEIEVPQSAAIFKLYLPQGCLQNQKFTPERKIEQKLDVCVLDHPRLLHQLLPYCDSQAIQTLFTCLSLDSVLTLMRRVLLDTSNILVGSSERQLTLCVQGIRALLFPYKYEQVCSPCLPKALLDRVDQQCIFLYGILQTHYRQEDLSQYIKDGTYIIDIDQNKIAQIPHTSVSLRRNGTRRSNQSEDLPDLPFTAVKRLKKQI